MLFGRSFAILMLRSVVYSCPCLIFAGGNGSFSNPSDVVDLQALPTITATTQQQDDEAIFLWIPLIVVIIFAAIIATLIIIGRQTNDACKCLRVSPGLESGNYTTAPPCVCSCD